MRSPVSFIPFNNMIRNSGLLEFPARGNKMSWQGRRGKEKGAVMIICRLDRTLANEEWHTLFPCSYTEYLGMVAYDHRPVVDLIRGGLAKKDLWNQLQWAGQIIGQDNLKVQWQKLAIVAMKLLNDGKIIPLMKG